jgi:uncharacterized membrane protein YhaH (DUF805 family)
MTFAQGRIGRKELWFGWIKLFFINIALAIPFQIWKFSATRGAENLAQYYLRHERWFHISVWFYFLTWLLLAAPNTSLMIRRRHDRNRSGLDVVIYQVCTLASFFVWILLAGNYEFDYVPSGVVPRFGAFDYIFMAVSLPFSMYMLIVLGFLKGVRGPTKYD